MADCRLDGIVHTTASAAHANLIGLYLRPRLQVLEGQVDISGPLLHFFRRLDWSGPDRAVGLIATVAIAAEVHGHDIDSGRGKLLGQAVPDLAVMVALVQEQDSGSWFPGGEVGYFDLDAVCRGQVEHLRGCRFFCCPTQRSVQKSKEESRG